MDVGNGYIKETSNHRYEINKTDATGGCHDAELKILRRLDESRLIRHQQTEQGAECSTHCLNHNARILRLQTGGDPAQKKSLGQCVNRG